MKLLLGYDFFDSKSNIKTPLYYDTTSLINGHMLFLGSSGVGKSYTIIRLLEDMRRQGIKTRVHVFDVHGDLVIPGSSTIVLSETATAGLNPFRINPDPEYGGVRKCIQTFIRVINQATSPPIGIKQESVVRNLLLDVFREYGFYADDPNTWALNEYDAQPLSRGTDNRLYLEVPFADKDRIKALGGRWDRDKGAWWVSHEAYVGDVKRWPLAFRPRRYPSLKDVADYCRRLHEERFLGSDQKAVRALQTLNRKAQAMQRRIIEDVKRTRVYSLASDEESASIDQAREDVIAAVTDYVNSVHTGFELENLMKYESHETLKSVSNRLDSLLATGLFKAEALNFDPSCSIWRYKLDARTNEEKKMFVLFKLEDLYYEAVQRGQQSDVVEIVVLDELGTYTSGADSDSGDGIIGVIAREARKYGLALWGAHQQPSGVPESLIASIGTKVIIGLDERYWKDAVATLRIDSKLIEWVHPWSTMAVQLKNKGTLKNRWRWVNIPPKAP